MQKLVKVAAVTTTGPTDARPIHVRIADDVRMRIESGVYEPGQRLPTLDDLCAQYLCSLAAVRSAMDLLRQQGLVITHQGRGSFVRERPTLRRHGMDRYRRKYWREKPLLISEADRQGHNVDQIIRELAEVPAPQAVADRLGIDAGTLVWVRRRTTVLDGRPNQLADSFYELSVVAGTPITQEDTQGGGFKVLDDRGYHLAEIEEELTTRMPTGPEKAALKLPEGTPVFQVIRTTFTSASRPIEVMISVAAGDMSSYVYRFPIPD